jgi:hypothetical protein
MLTAQKENNQINLQSLVHRPPTLRSFEKVVHSIDGLRERVQGLATEQLSETERQLQTMSLRLGALQQAVSALSEIKGLMSRMEQMLPQAQAASVDESTLASVGSFTPLHSLPHLVNLGKFRRIIKLVKAAKSVSVLLDSSDMKNQALILDIDAEAELPGLDRVVKLTALEHPFPEPVENSVIVGTAGECEEESEHTESLATSATNLVRTEPNWDEPVDIIPAKDTFNETIDGSVEATEDRPSSDAVDSTASAQPRTAVCKEPDFDRRLLDDLIKNYGEFNVVPNLPATTSAQKEVKHDDTPVSKRTTDSTAASNFASHRNLPTQRKDGELDRKLKKLIKDYGEYDLYSRQAPLNLKTGVFVAFLLLTLVFSGFYFFSSPKSVVHAPNSSPAVQSQDKGKGPANGETLSTRSGSNLDDAKPKDAGSSRNVSNNIVTKKTR